MTAWTHFWQGSLELEFALRIVLSCLCGFLIGLERTKRQKEAGLRTHILVALGAATVMIVSKYGFFDMSALSESGFFRVDPARIGSTILTGIGFLGAGVILQRGGAVRGLTTAAGVYGSRAAWAWRSVRACMCLASPVRCLWFSCRSRSSALHGARRSTITRITRSR